MELEQAMITASLAKKDRLEIISEVNDDNEKAGGRKPQSQQNES